MSYHVSFYPHGALDNDVNLYLNQCPICEKEEVRTDMDSTKPLPENYKCLGCNSKFYILKSTDMWDDWQVKVEWINNHVEIFDKYLSFVSFAKPASKKYKAFYRAALQAMEEIGEIIMTEAHKNN